MLRKWDRKKWLNTIQSLFSDTPWLCPVSELQDQEPEPLPIIEATISRAYSPLPDLIIEKEPNRYDESEEFYQVLERKVKNFLSSDRASCMETAIFSRELIRIGMSVGNDDQCTYTRDFFNLNKNKNPIRYGLEKKIAENVEKITEERTKNMHTETESTDTFKTEESGTYELIVSRAPVHNEGIEEKANRNIDIELEDLSSPNNDREFNSTSYEEESQNYEIIITQAHVHNAGSEKMDNGNNDAECRDLSIRNNDSEVTSVSDDGEPTCCESNDELSLNEPETMRRRNSSNDSVSSTKALSVAKYFSSEFANDTSFRITSFKDMEEAELSNPQMSSVLVITPTSEIIRNNETCEKIRKRRVSWETQVATKQKKIKECATQTSFNSSYEEINWHQIRRKFFEGNPKIFKLCSCSNHVCC